MANHGEVASAGQDYKAVLEKFVEAFGKSPDVDGVTAWKRPDDDIGRFNFRFLGEAYCLQLKLIAKTAKEVPGMYAGKVELLALDNDKNPIAGELALISIDRNGNMANQLPPLKDGAITGHSGKAEDVKKLLIAALATLLPKNE